MSPHAETRGVTSARVQAECLDQANRAVLRSAPIGPPAALLLATILGDSVSFTARAVLVAAVTFTNTFGLLAVWRYRVVQRTRSVTQWWPTPMYGLMVGTSWASLAVVDLPDPAHVEMRAIIALFAAGVSATQIVSAASLRSYFFAAQFPLLGILTIVYVAEPDRITHLLGFAFPIYLVVMVVLHHDVNKVVVSEIELKHANRDLIGDLTTQQAQVEDANAQLVAANERLTAIAMSDSLTGLANRPAILNVVDRAVQHARRDGTVVGVLFFDVDRFKIVNDSLGHSAGDELLIALATRIVAALRPVDTLGRLGGDEFVIVLPDLGDSYEAVVIAERVREVAAQPIAVMGRNVQVSISIGVATAIHAADGPSDLLRHADAAQYTAKQAGRDRVEVFDIELRSRVQHLVDAEIALRHALDDGRIVPWFQPQVDLVTGVIVGAEALARWIDPERGVIPPDEFLPIAESVGLMHRIDTTVVAQTIRARVELAALGVDPAFRVWANVSPGVLARGNQAERLAAFMQQANCDPVGIGIEITESGALLDIDAAQSELRAARRMGVRVALDDFGTGQSSLSLLRDLPIDEVKIDRTFVRDLASDPVDAAIVSGVTMIAQRLGLEVVAEGVETAEQEAEVRALGCRRAQGWLYGRPMPLADLVRHLGVDHDRVDRDVGCEPANVRAATDELRLGTAS